MPATKQQEPKLRKFKLMRGSHQGERSEEFPKGRIYRKGDFITTTKDLAAIFNQPPKGIKFIEVGMDYEEPRVKDSYSREELSRLKLDDLIVLAEQLEVRLEQGSTKKEVIESLLEATT